MAIVIITSVEMVKSFESTQCWQEFIVYIFLKITYLGIFYHLGSESPRIFRH